MKLCYLESGRLLNGHDRGITKVSFSPEGTYIATAGLDGRVCVWDVDSRDLLYSFNGSSPILSLVWIPPDEDTILCGLQDGNMAILRITPYNITVTGFWAHAYPVECLALNPGDNRLASGAHRELFVWNWIESTGKFILDKNAPAPLKSRWNQADEEIVTSVHWTTPAGSPALLLVTYMYHGVMLVDTSSWTRLRTVAVNGQIASLSDDGQRLAVCNTIRGFQIYCMRTGASLAAIGHDDGEDAHPKSVRFIHGSLALLGGSSTGELKVWDIMDTVTNGPTLNVPEGENPQPEVLHILPVPRRAQALAVDAYYFEDTDEDTDEFLIAAGVIDEASPSICVLWRATERGEGHDTEQSVQLRASGLSRKAVATILVLLGAVLLAYFWIDMIVVQTADA